MALHPVVLCGGSGTRLWPLSRTLLPKQFLALHGSRTMLQETALRIQPLDIAPPVLVSHAEHRFLAAEQLREIGMPASIHLLEPVGRNTAPAIAAAALSVASKERDALLLVLPSDHVIRDTAAFHEAIGRAARLAAKGRLATFGIVPTAPATGYGYIRRASPDAEVERAFEVAEFVEKPDARRAQGFLESGDYYWNSGMFLFGATGFIDELHRFRPDILESVRQALARAKLDLDFVCLDAEAFAQCPS